MAELTGGGASDTTLPASGTSTGTDVSLRDYMAAIREGDQRFNHERDRRLTEVATEREKALKIKETADLAALELAREIQTYKDEKANELRSQIERERGTYCTQQDLKGAVEKLEATIAPVVTYVTATRGSDHGAEAVVIAASRRTNTAIAAAVVIVSVVAVLVRFI